MEQHLAEKKEAIAPDGLPAFRFSGGYVFDAEIERHPEQREEIIRRRIREKDKARRKKDEALGLRARQVKAAVRARRDHGL